MPEVEKQPDRQILWKDSYTTKKFIFQSGLLMFTIYLWSKLVMHTVQYYNQNAIIVVLGFVIAQFFVDFLSGIMHWSCDTWGHFQTPIIGPTLIRTFRMHHVDPQDITKHGFIQTNASSSYPTIFFILTGLMITPNSYFGQIYEWTIIFGAVLAILTNQIHKWAHIVHSKPHRVIQFLQKSRLIINHQQHHKHHQDKFDTSYCIINGWMNPFLQKIGFWKKLQNLIVKLTGAVPRVDDAYWRPKYKY